MSCRPTHIACVGAVTNLNAEMIIKLARPRPYSRVELKMDRAVAVWCAALPLHKLSRVGIGKSWLNSAAAMI